MTRVVYELTEAFDYCIPCLDGFRGGYERGKIFPGRIEENTARLYFGELFEKAVALGVLVRVP